MIIADSNVLIDYLRGERAADRIAFELGHGQLATTCISAFELVVGATTPRRVSAVNDLLGALRILPLTAEAAQRSGVVHRDLEASGNRIGMADALIAGICLEAGAILLSHNVKHFSRVVGLSLGTV